MKIFENIDITKLKKSLKKTRDNIVSRLTETISGKAQIDDDTLEEIEEILITSDIGVKTAELIIENTRKELKRSSDKSKKEIIEIIKKIIIEILHSGNDDKSEYLQIEEFKPFVILIVGVNGAGKTTTIAKLAYNYKKAGLKVIIGSADTFRAAANEQLNIWAHRVGVEIVQRAHGSDPSSVVFETLAAAKSKKTDVVLIDTAGRLHTKNNLMNELKKISLVMKKVISHAPNETFLVVDANTGQNAFTQADQFSKSAELTGLIITKLDGTAKGGAIFQICAEKKLPIRYIGVGENLDDLQTFDPESFAQALFE